MPDASTLLSRSQARAYDAWCMRDIGIPGLLLMECAACGIAAEAARAWPHGAGPAPLFVAVCGPGQNGGDGYAAVRHLHSGGADAVALESGAPRPGTDAALQHRIAQTLGLARPFAESISGIESAAATRRLVVIDALFGTGLERPLAGMDAVRALWINSMRARGAKVVSVDVPSGMDCDNGTAHDGTCVEADITVTMVAPKVGFASPAAARLLGTVVTVPIGGPPVAEFLACAEGQRLRPAAPVTAGTTEAQARTQPPA